MIILIFFENIILVYVLLTYPRLPAKSPDYANIIKISFGEQTKCTG